MPPAPPLIGVTAHPATAPDAQELDLFFGWILQGVQQAGGLPIPIPPTLDAAALGAFYERLDGVLFSGGGDVDPARYGAELDGRIGGVDAGRDETELALARWAARDGKPFFGICRGAQVINVAHGGTLYSDTAEHPGAARHAYYPDLPYDLLAHPACVAEGSLLSRLIGAGEAGVNSLHHQACRDVAPALLASARAPDGIVEAVELPGHPFGLAVQWHPECLLDAPATRRLFGAFVNAAAARGLERR
jgi:putative glutamine amidotransferase